MGKQLDLKERRREKKRKGKRERARDGERSSLRSRAHRQRSRDPAPVLIIRTFKRFDSDGTEIRWQSASLNQPQYLAPANRSCGAAA